MNVLWFVILIACFVAVQKDLYKKYIFRHLVVCRGFKNTGLFPDDTTDFEVTMINNKLLPITWLKVKQEIPVGLEFIHKNDTHLEDGSKIFHRIVLSILPYQKVKRNYKIRCVKRGCYELLDDVQLTSTDLFGIQEHKSYTYDSARIVVYPRIISLKNAFVLGNTLQGDQFVKRWIVDDPMVVAGIRDYTATDSLKSINWKMTAKNQDLKVNKYDFTTDKKVMVIFNLDLHQYQFTSLDETLIEKAIEVAASFAVELIEEGVSTGFGTNAFCRGETENSLIQPGTGQRHMVEILEVCAGISYYKKYSFEELMDRLERNFSWGTELVVVTTSISEDLIHGIGRRNLSKTTVISLTEEQTNHLPGNVDLFFIHGEGEQLEAI